MTLVQTDLLFLLALGGVGGLAAALTARAYLRTRYRSMLWLTVALCLLTAGPVVEHLLLSLFHWPLNSHDAAHLGLHAIPVAGLLAVVVSALQARQVPEPTPSTGH
ncbi:MAG: hypothetical protein QXO51_03515 [Halobacteria archaeon]